MLNGDQGISEGNGEYTWPSLLGGQESAAARQARQNQFQTAWNLQQAKIDGIANKVDDSFVDDILQYVNSEEEDQLHGRIKTGLITSAPGTNTQRGLLQGWKKRQSPDSSALLIELQPSHAPNLQTALKNVIKLALCQKGGLEGYTSFLAENKAMIPMNFDLELLQRYMNKEHKSRTIVSVPEIEAFDTGILSELISTFHSWSDRIRSVLLIGISTTIELFESRLPRSIISLLDARVFQPTGSAKQHDPLFEIYSAIQRDDAEIFLGPSTLSVFAELAQDQSTTTEGFARTIKYAFMSHFFANPLSVVNGSSDELNIPMSLPLAQAVRNTEDFKDHCESLSKGTAAQRKRARELIKSDTVLEEEVTQAVQSGKRSLQSSLRAIHTLQQLYQRLVGPMALPLLESQTKLLASLPNMTDCEIFDSIEDALQEIPSLEQFKALMTFVSDNLNDLNTFQPGTDEPDHDTPTFAGLYDTLISTNSSVETDLSRLTQLFLSLLRTYTTTRTSFLSGTSSSPWRSLMSEAYTYNLKHPLSSIIHPRARYSLERALTKPADYLGCDCCAAQSGVLDDKSSLPPTSLLLNMLNEAGAVINVRDLWDAFRSTIAPSSLDAKETEVAAAEDADQDGGGGGGKDDDEEDQGGEATATTATPDNDDAEVEATDADTDTERKALALFYRSLAELRHLGLIRQSKRKPGVDCIAKTAWMGL